MKERCRVYGTTEKEGVSHSWKYRVVSKRSEESTILLDTDVAFSKDDGLDRIAAGERRKKQDRMDLLFYNTEKKLCFWEAGDVSNKELLVKEGDAPAVDDRKKIISSRTMIRLIGSRRIKYMCSICAAFQRPF